ncbi:MAG: hypothetical protein O3C17_16640 [Planctomycetota bacterium]|nr:hypothetical protein [Planctomycetota bacterium]
MVELVDLWLPILLSSVAIFIVSSMCWTMLPHHRPDLQKLDKEDEVIEFVRGLGVADGNYTFPYCGNPEDFKNSDLKKKWEDGPRGLLCTFPLASMGGNMAKTFVVWLLSVFSIAYLATMGITDQAAPLLVFRFFATASLLTYFVAVVPGSIWYHSRIKGHLIDAIAYALIVGAIFAWRWPYVEAV